MRAILHTRSSNMCCMCTSRPMQAYTRCRNHPMPMKFVHSGVLGAGPAASDRHARVGTCATQPKRTDENDEMKCADVVEHSEQGHPSERRLGSSASGVLQCIAIPAANENCSSFIDCDLTGIGPHTCVLIGVRDNHSTEHLKQFCITIRKRET
jgi:hypothetical protein